MSGFFRVQVTHRVDSGNPADFLVNTFHFDSDQSFEDDADDVVGRVDTFFDAIAPSLFHIRMAGLADVKVYDMADEEPRPPRIVTTISYAPSTNNAVVPGEVAIALSYKATQPGGVPAGRLRGRQFIGLVSGTALELLADGVHVTAAARTTLTNAAAALCVGPDPGDARLAIFSRTIALHGRDPKTVSQFTLQELDDAHHDVTQVWCDDAVDTMRSRGVDPILRTTVNIP